MDLMSAAVAHIENRDQAMEDADAKQVELQGLPVRMPDDLVALDEKAKKGARADLTLFTLSLVFF
jgi:hypothetical protein